MTQSLMQMIIIRISENPKRVLMVAVALRGAEEAEGTEGAEKAGGVADAADGDGRRGTGAAGRRSRFLAPLVVTATECLMERS